MKNYSTTTWTFDWVSQFSFRLKEKIRGQFWSGSIAFLVFNSSFLIFSACQSEQETMRQKYITEGIYLYRTNCANCHQADGAGLAGLYPPLANSDYLKANKSSVICSIKYGQQGPLLVNGKRYNRVMPAQLNLSDLEVAEISTYIYSKWGGDKALISAKEAAKILAECAKKD